MKLLLLSLLLKIFGFLCLKILIKAHFSLHDQEFFRTYQRKDIARFTD